MANGHTVHLIAPDYLTASADETDVFRVPARQLPIDPEDRLMSFKWVMMHLKRLKSEHYDIIHIQPPFAAHYLGTKLARLLGIPCVETCHTFFEEYLHHYVPLVPRKLMRYVAKRFSGHQGNSLDGMVVPSHPMQHVLKNYGITTPTQVIPTGIQPESFVPGDREAFRQQHQISYDRPVLLFLGRVAHEKNIGFLIEMLDHVKRAIPDVLFVVAGEGPARANLLKTVDNKGLGDNVRFIGYLDRNTEINNFYSSADIFVFSSRTETQGLLLLEAMAQDLSVVSTAEQGTRNVLQEGAGVWIAQEDALDFSGKVVRMLGDAQLRKDLGNAGRNYAREWSASQQTQRLLKFYGVVINPSTGPLPSTPMAPQNQVKTGVRRPPTS